MPFETDGRAAAAAMADPGAADAATEAGRGVFESDSRVGSIECVRKPNKGQREDSVNKPTIAHRFPTVALQQSHQATDLLGLLTNLIQKMLALRGLASLLPPRNFALMVPIRTATTHRGVAEQVRILWKLASNLEVLTPDTSGAMRSECRGEGRRGQTIEGHRWRLRKAQRKEE